MLSVHLCFVNTPWEIRTLTLLGALELKSNVAASYTKGAYYRHYPDSNRNIAHHDY